MVVYIEMLYGLSRNNSEVKTAYANALKKYCKLDTLAMVIIWFHWKDLRNKLTNRDALLND